MQSWIWRQLIQ